MQDDIERVLIDRRAIADRLDQLAAEIVADLRGATELTIVPILTGSIIFVSDLIRRMPVKMKIRFMGVTSYPGASTSSRGAAIIDALTHVPESLEGHHVLVIDDILDSGKTLRLVNEVLRLRRPTELRTCVLLRKQIEAAMNTPVDYVAFDIPAEFVVGYGLDYDDYYRNLPDICTLKPEVIGARAEDKLRLAAEAQGNEAEQLAAQANVLIPAQLLQSGEIIVLLLKPSALFIVLGCLPTLFILALITVAVTAAERAFPTGVGEAQIVIVGLALITARIFWQFMEWLSRVYVLTDRRVVRVQGVLRISIFEAPLQQVQHTNLIFSLRERLFGLGTIAFATAGTAYTEVAWVMLADPLDVHQKVVETINRYRR